MYFHPVTSREPLYWESRQRVTLSSGAKKILYLLHLLHLLQLLHLLYRISRHNAAPIRTIF